ncbi:DUF6503 family protein [Fulvivirga lutimaris]|uniref:DUF6503 family protein n=1 Tax=Fulvivirga lutimaris TaxID=1819566 RepID=UPI0012BC4086|nr:DUF6503 family protein [Fulvivirga lutimaris]MTI41433.1 hypothetical protein [Fulvivirga lutimaris]
MNRLIVTLIAVLLPLIGFSQSAKDILSNSISYHDPNGFWNSFQGNLKIDLNQPDGSNRKSDINIDLPKAEFSMTERRGEDVVTRVIDKEGCSILFNGRSDFSKEESKKFGLTCDRASMYKNYYTFLYGLPMKLKDSGTILHNELEQVEFKGNDYLKLKITFEEGVGTDTWYIYLNPETYAMEVYQFYHDETKNDGEYILLSELIEYRGMQIPKVRKWYTNKEDKWLGTDDLVSISSLR